MEALSVGEIPVGEQWQYEPKWDGFRCILGRNGKKVAMTSKSGQNLARYFPEVVRAAAALPERRFMLDGELVVDVNCDVGCDCGGFGCSVGPLA
jgi:ATP-dependent DNA ligase